MLTIESIGGAKMNTRTANNYTQDKVGDFLGAVRMAIQRGDDCKMTFNQICRLFKFGSIALPALKNCGFIQVNGRGFKNWKWTLGHPVFADDVMNFIAEIERQKTEHGKIYRSKKTIQEIQPTNVVSFKPTEHKKAVQVELPIHPVRLTLLNEIKNELNEIRFQTENHWTEIQNRLERIEDQIDQESVKKSAER
jgi:hypothetical protein